MPWDNSLNQDIHLSVDRHVLFTSNYEEDDERKFSLSSPKRASHAHRRLVHPTTGVVPASDRIVQDVRKVLSELLNIHKRKGVKDPKMKRTGNRWIPDTEERRGGKRTKKAFRDYVLHPDVLDGRRMKVERSLLLCEKADEESDKNNAVKFWCQLDLRMYSTYVSTVLGGSSVV